VCSSCFLRVSGTGSRDCAKRESRMEDAKSSSSRWWGVVMDVLGTTLCKLCSHEQQLQCVDIRNAIYLCFVQFVMFARNMRHLLTCKTPDVHQGLLSHKTPDVHQGLSTQKNPNVHWELSTQKTPNVHQELSTQIKFPMCIGNCQHIKLQS
jgi:hypothetical protein